MVSVSFTGHRPNKIGGYENEIPEQVEKTKNWIEETTRKIIEKFDDIHFISGGAQGVDLWAAEIVLQHKEEYKNKNITLTMAIPCPQFGEKWPIETRNILNYYNSVADRQIYVRSSYTGPIVLQIRNEWMVNRSDIVLAVWDGSAGGTRNCFVYAKDLDKRILRFNPLTYETTKYK